MFCLMQDEQSSTAMLNKHKILEDSVKDYNDVIQQLDNTRRNHIDQKHPERLATLNDHKM